MIGKLLGIIGFLFLFWAWFNIGIAIEIFQSTLKLLIEVYDKYQPLVMEILNAR